MESDIKKRLSCNVKFFRCSRGFTTKELSLLSGLNHSYISKLERKSLNITIDRVAIIAKALGVEVYQLLE